MDDTLDLSYDGTMQDATVYGDVKRGGTGNSPKPAIIDPSLSGPDPSVGNPTELYNTSIQVKPAVLKILCLKGVTIQTRKDMMDAMPDVVSLPDPTRFKDFTLLHVNHHARHLRQIRMYATRRSQMILRTYTYLRDAHAKGYINIKLVGIVTQKLQDMTQTLADQQALLADQKPPKDWACNHCHSELHEGGMVTCPLTDFKAKIACRIARDAGKKIKDEPDILDRLIAKERTKKV
jgi:hypothetical protein